MSPSITDVALDLDRDQLALPRSTVYGHGHQWRSVTSGGPGGTFGLGAPSLCLSPSLLIGGPGVSPPENF
jgi:hypothetical protein